MEQGWIKLHRKILENPIMRKPNYLSLWVALLLKANHKDNKMIWNNNIIVIKEGQFITGRDSLSKETGIPPTTIERILNFLESGHQIEQQKNNKYRLITIVKWEDYQKTDSKVDNKRTSSGHPVDTNKNDKKVNNEKNTEQSSESITFLIKSFETLNPAVKKFYGNTTQRKACNDLIETYGYDRVLLVITETLPRTNKMTSEFFPNISTPLQLFDKWQKLEDAVFAYRARKQIKSNNVIW